MSTYQPPDIDPPPDRRIAFAVELWDPIGARPVWRGIEPRIKSRDQKPIVNRSGRFVWMGQPDQWPDAISVDMGTEPFESLRDVKLEQRKPTGWPMVAPKQRLIRIALTPTAAYRHSGEVTGVRGDLYEPDSTDPKKRKALTDATVWLEWFDKGQEKFLGGEESTRVTTTDRGNFTAFVRVPRANVDPDLEDGQLLVRLVFVRDLGTKITKTTKATHQFLPEPAPPGRISASGAMEHWTSVDWAQL